nr:hypothetical protein [Pseudomonas alcaliphila]
MQQPIEHKTKPCKYCNQLFEYKRKTAEFCTEAHKKAWQRARTNRLDKQRKYRFSTSAFTFYLADACRRSGTIQVLPKTLSELEKLHTLYKFSLKANGYGEDDQFSLCHLFPVKHPRYIGSMHADNLVVSYRDLNAKHGNAFVQSAGHKISRLDLSAKWLVRAEDTKSSVVAKIIEYYGEDFTATIAVKLKLQPAKRQASLDWLMQCNDSRVPAHTELEQMTTAALTKLKSEISGKSGGYLPDSGIDATGVFLSELKRLSHTRPEFEQVAERWLEAMPSIVGHFHALHWSRPKAGGSESEYREALAPIAHLRQAQFDLLHGGNVEDFLTVLNTFLTSESLVLPTALESVPLTESNLPLQKDHYPRAVFSPEDVQELEALERMQDAALEENIFGAMRQPIKPKSAWERFIS